MAIKAKNITIRICSLDQGLDNFAEAAEAAEALLRGESIKNSEVSTLKILTLFGGYSLKRE